MKNKQTIENDPCRSINNETGLWHAEMRTAIAATQQMKNRQAPRINGRAIERPKTDSHESKDPMLKNEKYRKTPGAWIILSSPEGRQPHGMGN